MPNIKYVPSECCMAVVEWWKGGSTTLENENGPPGLPLLLLATIDSELVLNCFSEQFLAMALANRYTSLVSFSLTGTPPHDFMVVFR